MVPNILQMLNITKDNKYSKKFPGGNIALHV